MNMAYKKKHLKKQNKRSKNKRKKSKKATEWQNTVKTFKIS